MRPIKTMTNRKFIEEARAIFRSRLDEFLSEEAWLEKARDHIKRRHLDDRELLGPLIGRLVDGTATWSDFGGHLKGIRAGDAERAFWGFATLAPPDARTALARELLLRAMVSEDVFREFQRNPCWPHERHPSFERLSGALRKFADAKFPAVKIDPSDLRSLTGFVCNDALHCFLANQFVARGKRILAERGEPGARTPPAMTKEMLAEPNPVPEADDDERDRMHAARHAERVGSGTALAETEVARRTMEAWRNDSGEADLAARVVRAADAGCGPNPPDPRWRLFAEATAAHLAGREVARAISILPEDGLADAGPIGARLAAVYSALSVPHPLSARGLLLAPTMELHRRLGGERAATPAAVRAFLLGTAVATAECSASARISDSCSKAAKAGLAYGRDDLMRDALLGVAEDYLAMGSGIVLSPLLREEGLFPFAPKEIARTMGQLVCLRSGTRIPMMLGSDEEAHLPGSDGPWTGSAAGGFVSGNPELHDWISCQRDLIPFVVRQAGETAFGAFGSLWQFGRGNAKESLPPCRLMFENMGALARATALDRAGEFAELAGVAARIGELFGLWDGDGDVDALFDLCCMHERILPGSADADEAAMARFAGIPTEWFRDGPPVETVEGWLASEERADYHMQDACALLWCCGLPDAIPALCAATGHAEPLAAAALHLSNAALQFEATARATALGPQPRSASEAANLRRGAAHFERMALEAGCGLAAPTSAAPNRDSI